MEKIMVVDDNITNLNLAKAALESHYRVTPMPSGEAALKKIEKIEPDLILLDVEMPDMNGFEVIEKIKALGEPFTKIPIIFLTAKDDSSSEMVGFDLGAVDYIIKPFSPPLLTKRVELHLKLAHQQRLLENYSHELEEQVNIKTRTIQNLQYAIVHVLSDMVERRDGSTGSHLIRTSEYLRVLLLKAKQMGVYPELLADADVEVLAHASKLHDIGKIVIPDSILLKSGKLTPSEFEIMKEHAIEGEKAIRYAIEQVQESEFLKFAADFTGAHHEKWDGSGYPRGKKGEDIPICGRLMAIADVYDALISRRTYKPFFDHDQALSIIFEGDGTHFDPVLMGVFREVTDDFKAISDQHRDAYDEEENSKEITLEQIQGAL